MVARIAAPDRARVDLQLDTAALCSPARVVHLGQSAIVLRAVFSSTGDPVLVTVTDGTVGVTPGGISIPRASTYARVRADFLAVGLGRIVELSPWVSDSLLVPVDLRLAQRRMADATITAVAHELLTTPTLPMHSSFDGGLSRVRSRATDLAAAALALEPQRVLPDIVGAGPGTTPTGDDMVVGCHAALAVLGRTDAASRLSEATAPLLAATTTSSRHYLAAAASGRFAEHVHTLVAGFERGRPADLLLDDARRWGATSGVDLLTGLAATLQADLVGRYARGAA